MVDLTSVIFAFRSSLWEMGVGNLPAAKSISVTRICGDKEAYPWIDQGPRDEESA